MHVRSEKDPVEIGVQGYCTISCITMLIVKVVHAIGGRPMKILKFIFVEFPN